MMSAMALVGPIAEDIRDIRGPIEIPPWWRWPLAIAIALLAALAVTVAVRWWRARRARAISPHERARRALAIAETHAREGQSQAWAEIVADTIRGALANRLGFDILPLTTPELRAREWPPPLLPPGLDTAQVLALLDTCDLARFAKAALDREALVALTAVARDQTEALYAPRPRAPKEAAPVALPVTP